MSVRQATERDCTFKFGKCDDVLTYNGADYPLTRSAGLVWLPTVSKAAAPRSCLPCLCRGHPASSPVPSP